MLMPHIKKSWDPAALQKKVFDSGITNRLIGFYVKSDPSIMVSTQFAELGRSDIVMSNLQCQNRTNY